MKKVIVVSKTHLDLGFTDYAENIKQKYIHSFIPDAIDLAEKVNTADKKYFIWTTSLSSVNPYNFTFISSRKYLKSYILSYTFFIYNKSFSAV